MDIEPTYRFNTQDEYDEYLDEQQRREDWEHEQYDVQRDMENER